MEELRVTFRDDRICIAESGSVFISVFLEAGTTEIVGVMDREEGRFARGHERFSLVTVVPEVPMRRPPVGLGDQAAGMLRRYGGQLVGAAVIITGHGFLASIARSALSAAVLLSRTDAPVRTFGECRQGAEWLAGLEGQSPDFAAPALTTHLAQLLLELEVAL